MHDSKRSVARPNCQQLSAGRLPRPALKRLRRGDQSLDGGECRRRIYVAVLSGFALPAYAHGEQVLVFLGTFALLLILAVVIVAIPWHKSRLVRTGAATVLLASNVALWFSPLVPQSVSALA